MEVILRRFAGGVWCGEPDCDWWAGDGRYWRARRSVCGKSTTMYWLAGVVGGCDYSLSMCSELLLKWQKQ